MLPDEIQDEEILYRGIHPNHTKEENGQVRVSSAAFKDSFGNSVDRDGNRNEEDIINFILERFPDKGIANIVASDCRENNTKPVSKPVEGNPFHALIIRQNGDLQLKPREAKKLRRASNTLFLPGKSDVYLDN